MVESSLELWQTIKWVWWLFNIIIFNLAAYKYFDK
jgi:hypothetical protein